MVNDYSQHPLLNLAPCHSALASFLLQLCLLICVLGGLSVLRRDAELLVLGPLRRMLKIVAQYAKNPLAPAKVRSTVKRKAFPSHFEH